MSKREIGIISETPRITDRESLFGSENIVFSEVEENINLEDKNNLKADTDVLISTARMPLIEPPTSPNEKKTLITSRTCKFDPKFIAKETQQTDSHRDHIIESKLDSAKGSQTSHEQRMYKMFQTNVRMKTYPRSFKPLCFMFYLVILIALVSQIILKMVSDSTLKDLVLKKNLLTYSQLRSYRANLIVINYFGFMVELFDPLQIVMKQSGQNVWPLSAIVANANSYEPDMKKYNQLIANNIAPLDDKIKQQILSKDVRIYGTMVDSYSSEYVSGTMFDAVDMIISAMHKLSHVNNYNSTEALQLANFLVTNILNDFMYKSTETTNIFVNSVSTERESLESVLLLVLIVSPLLLTGIAFMLIVIIQHQYAITKKQLLAFITINANQVKDILTSFNRFKDILTGEGLSENKHCSTDYFLKIALASQNPQEKIYRKQNQDRRIQYTEIKKKYYGYFFRVIFYILILIGVMSWNYATAHNSVNTIYRRQSQLEFANHISEMVCSNYVTIVSLPFFNNTYKVKHLSQLEAGTLGLADAKKVRSQVIEAFQEVDGTYDPRVKALLLEHRSCKEINFTLASSRAYCTYQEQAGQLLDLVSLLTVHESITYDKLQDWNTTCNRSTINDLLQCGFKQYNIYLQTFGLAAVEAFMIGDIVGANLEKSVSEAYSQRALLLVIFSISLIAVSLLTWFQILSRLREVHNEFKKVLQVFPPAFVMSNFLVKMFLQKTSRGILSFTDWFL